MSASKRIVITGATGQIGRVLSRRLIEAGAEVVVLSRDPGRARATVPGAADYVAWEPAETGPWAAVVDGADAVVGLAGAPFFRKWKSRGEFEHLGFHDRLGEEADAFPQDVDLATGAHLGRVSSKDMLSSAIVVFSVSSVATPTTRG